MNIKLLILIFCHFKKFRILYDKTFFLKAVDKPICAFWNETIRDFSTVGCNLIQQEQNGIYLCQCDHATFFALIGVSKIFS